MSSEQKLQVITDMLDDMVGNSYNYGGKVHRINNYKVDERGRIRIMTNLKEYDRDLESIDVFLNHFQPVKQNELPAVQTEKPELIAPQIRMDAIGSFNDLKTILMDNIKKVQTDKNYIPQAEAIQSNVNSIIDLAKTEVAYMEAFVRLRKNGEV